MAKDGNINDSGPIQSGRNVKSIKNYTNNYDNIFRKKKAKEEKDEKK